MGDIARARGKIPDQRAQAMHGQSIGQRFPGQTALNTLLIGAKPVEGCIGVVLIGIADLSVRDRVLLTTFRASIDLLPSQFYACG